MRPQWPNPLPSSTSSSPAAARPDWRSRPRSSRRWGKAHPSPSSIRGRRPGQAQARCARSRSPMGRAACSNISAPGRRSSRRRNRSCRWRSWTATCATPCACPISISLRKTRPLAHMAFNDDVVGALSALCDRLGVQRVTGSVAHWASGKHVGRARAIRRPRVARAPRGRRRRRALETQPARRHSDHRLGL